MAKNVGAIEYDIKGNTTQIKKDLDETEKAANKTGQKIGAAFKTAASATVKAFAAATAAVSAALVKFGKMGVEYNAELEKYTTAFTTLLGSEKEASAVMAQIKKDAAATPFNVQGLTQANQLLIGAGVSAEDARKTIIALGDAVSATGGGSDELSRMAANLQQIKNVGKATSMDIRQFAMAGINIYGLLADYTGKTTEEVKDMEVSYDVLSAALMQASQEGGRYYGAMEKQSHTFNGQLSTLKDNAMSFLGEMTQGLSDIATNTVLPTLTGWVRDLSEAFAGGNWDALFDKAGDIINELILKVVSFAPKIVSFAVDIVKKLVRTLKDNSRLILDAVFEIAKTVLEGAIEVFPDVLAFAGDVILALVEGLAAALPDLLPKIVEIAFAMIDQLIAMLPDFIDAAITLILALAEGLIKAIPLLIEKIPVLVESLVTALIEALPQIIDGVLLLFDMLVEALPDLIIALVDAIPKIVLALVSALTKDDNLQKFISGWIKLFMSLVTAIPRIIWELLQHLPEILNALWNGIVGFADEMQGAGWELLEGLWNGIKDAFAWVWSKITGLFDGMVKGIKSFFGIASPSKLFRDLIGKNLDLGLAIGIEENADLPEDAALEMSTSVIHKMLLPDVSGLLGASPFAGLTNKNVVSVNNRLTGELVVDGYKLGEVVFKSFDDNYAYSGRA